MTLARMLAALAMTLVLALGAVLTPSGAAKAEGSELPTIVTVAIGPSVVGSFYSQQVAASGRDITFSLAPGAPAGMTITSDGFLEWAPPSAGSFGFEIIVSNAAGEARKQYTFAVAAAAGELAPDAPAGVIDLPTLSEPEAAPVQDRADAGPGADPLLVSGMSLLLLFFIIGMALVFRNRITRA